ncbi:hypothetical protein [Wenxinia marina]|uniref:Uncharacterized protein n=1 Tax=Wenxinia marina DSM 24838 TaxID=1123501 RepID=A0A0D0Q859_9RHOB|nr:hypothetical protein [Wenxinia marina]KIQ68602.1 hypothetical protein Wenmar_02873 [Wenxinia marina DSM 24838]GGL67219.1 hypothetical protein GCM10011392_22160 [Wenxinia marina]
MDAGKITGWAEDLRALIEERLRLRAPDLTRALARAGRRLPRKVRRAAAQVDEAARLTQHPKLSRQIDLAGVEAAHGLAAAHLRAIDPKAERRRRILDWLALIALNLLLIGIALVAWLRWRGLV